MARHFKILFPVILILILILIVSSCASGQDRLSPEWTEAMFFKNAQEAMDGDQYDLALYYYEVFLVRYPENHQRTIAAEYELAFIHYKKGEYSKAGEGYEAILRKYDESPYAMLYHPRFRYLSELGLETIERKKFVERRLFWRTREEQWADDHDESLIDEGLES